MNRLDELFRALHEASGSDLHLVTGVEPRQRVHGEIVPIGSWGVLSRDVLTELLEQAIARDPFFMALRDAQATHAAIEAA